MRRPAPGTAIGSPSQSIPHALGTVSLTANQHHLPGSENSVSPLFFFGNPAPLDAASVHQARRVVVKHPTREALPGGLVNDVSEIMTARKSRVQYDVLPPLGRL